MTRSTSGPRPDADNDDDMDFDGRVALITRALDGASHVERLGLLSLASGWVLAEIPANERVAARDGLVGLIDDTSRDATIRACDA